MLKKGLGGMRSTIYVNHIARNFSNFMSLSLALSRASISILVSTHIFIEKHFHIEHPSVGCDRRAVNFFGLAYSCGLVPKRFRWSITQKSGINTAVVPYRFIAVSQ
jgi:hypothetical protein